MADPEESSTAPAPGRPPSPGPGTLVLVLGGPIARADIPALCDRVRAVLSRSDAEVVVLDVSGVSDPDAVTLDVLARVVLAARRLGRQVWVRNAGEQLRELVTLAGLWDIMSPRDPPS